MDVHDTRHHGCQQALGLREDCLLGIRQSLAQMETGLGQVLIHAIAVRVVQMSVLVLIRTAGCLSVEDDGVRLQGQRHLQHAPRLRTAERARSGHLGHIEILGCRSGRSEELSVASLLEAHDMGTNNTTELGCRH